MPRGCWSALELILAVVAVALLYPILARFVLAFSEAAGGRRP